MSTFRPVLGIFDIDIIKVTEEKKNERLHDVVAQQGPPDGTVIVSMATGEFDDDMIDSIVETFSDIGEIILVRWVYNLEEYFYVSGMKFGSILFLACLSLSLHLCEKKL